MFRREEDCEEGQELHDEIDDEDEENEERDVDSRAHSKDVRGFYHRLREMSSRSNGEIQEQLRRVSWIEELV